MKYRKIIVASIFTVIILAISYTASYYKTLEDERQFTQKRNAIFEYLHKNNNTGFPHELSDDNRRPH